MRLSDAGLHQRQTKALDPNHRPPPWPTEATARDRSNRLLGPVLRRRIIAKCQNSNDPKQNNRHEKCHGNTNNSPPRVLGPTISS